MPGLDRAWCSPHQQCSVDGAVVMSGTVSPSAACRTSPLADQAFMNEGSRGAVRFTTPVSAGHYSAEPGIRTQTSQAPARAGQST